VGVTLVSIIESGLTSREMEIQDFTKEYQSKTDEELLRLELVSEELTTEANAALQGELASRQINQWNRSYGRLSRARAKRLTELARNPGRLFSVYSFGRSRFGKARYVHDSETGWNGLRRQFSSYCSISRLYQPVPFLARENAGSSPTK